MFKNLIRDMNVARSALFDNSSMSIQTKNERFVGSHEVIAEFVSHFTLLQVPIISGGEQLTSSPFNIEV